MLPTASGCGGWPRSGVKATLIPVLTDPGRIAAMSARASAAGAPDAGIVLAWHVLTAVAGRRRLAS
jgi:UDP-N-acetylglucosamine--N-acetylmuramyl-(pentapeptide) pyrophosphoryl-undecaprenol N-acetylglucosamine transferase